jgi:hypothetical protein
MATMTLREDDLPALYKVEDNDSIRSQKRFTVSLAVELALLVLVAAASAIASSFSTRINTSSSKTIEILAAATLVVAFVVRAVRHNRKLEKRWYETRSIAESAKTLAWRYAVGGNPFSKDSRDESATATLLERRLQEVHESIAPQHTRHGRDEDEITPRMRDIRALSLAERRTAYDIGRILDQRDWYRRKAAWNKKRARQWSALLLAIELAGATAAILRALGVIELDLLAIAVAAVAAGTSWTQARQHQTLAASYSVAELELSTIHDRLLHNPPETEQEWARFVRDAEDAISREHRLWHASRSETLDPATIVIDPRNSQA